MLLPVQTADVREVAGGEPALFIVVHVFVAGL